MFCSVPIQYCNRERILLDRVQGDGSRYPNAKLRVLILKHLLPCPHRTFVGAIKRVQANTIRKLNTIYKNSAASVRETERNIFNPGKISTWTRWIFSTIEEVEDDTITNLMYFESIYLCSPLHKLLGRKVINSVQGTTVIQMGWMTWQEIVREGVSLKNDNKPWGCRAENIGIRWQSDNKPSINGMHSNREGLSTSILQLVDQDRKGPETDLNQNL